MTEKRVWLFREGNATMRNLLGGKGANLAEMTNLGLPVPPGLTITTETCMDYINNGNKMPEGLMDEVKAALKDVEEQKGQKFGDSENPLLVSVRSGARVSMPGMMETILNLGLNDKTVEGMIKLTNNPRFCYDSYRRFLTMFGSGALQTCPYFGGRNFMKSSFYVSVSPASENLSYFFYYLIYVLLGWDYSIFNTACYSRVFG